MCRKVMQTCWEKRIGIEAGGDITFHQKISTVQDSWHQLVHRVFCNACTWPEVEDLMYFGRSTCWPEQSPTGTKPCDKGQARLSSYITDTKHHRQCCVVGDEIQDCKLFQDVSILLETCKTPDQFQAECHAHLDHKKIRCHGCSRRKLPYLTAVPNQQ